MPLRAAAVALETVQGGLGPSPADPLSLDLRPLVPRVQGDLISRVMGDERKGALQAYHFSLVFFTPLTPSLICNRFAVSQGASRSSTRTPSLASFLR